MGHYLLGKALIVSTMVGMALVSTGALARDPLPNAASPKADSSAQPGQLQAVVIALPLQANGSRAAQSPNAASSAQPKGPAPTSMPSTRP